ncbi:MAG: hypothetical protein H6625_12005 [Bdellovibrionaceae bacterium]|nr:hypothetical protein [Pseudobdellovibrionaceae bacterium]
MLRTIFYLSIVLIQISINTGCNTNTEIEYKTIYIRGSIKPLSGVSQKKSKLQLLSCTTPIVYLYELSEEGEKITPAIGQSTVNENGSYSVAPSSSQISLESGKIKYLVEVDGCTDLLSRPITDSTGQDVSYSSSLLSYIIGTSYGSKLTKANNDDFKNLLEELSSTSDISTAFTTLNSNSEVRELFTSIFGVGPSVLLEFPPKILFTNVPKILNEEQSYSFAAAFAHWSPSYISSALWKENSKVLGTSANITWTPDANSQGLKTISLFWGKDDGSGNLDLTKPFKSKNFIVNVNNNILPTPPTFNLVSDAITQSILISTSMDTGPSLLNCKSFSSLALTSSLTLPSASDFNINCTTDITQNLADYTMTGPDGHRSLYLWAKDASSQVSASPSVVNFTLDREAPVITNTSINGGAAYAGTALTFVNISLTDNISSPSQIKVRVKSANVSDSDCQSEYADNDWIDYVNSTTNIPHQISQTDGLKKVCVWAKDLAGNISVMSPTSGIDGVNTDTIIYQVGSPPVVSNFSVIRDLGGRLATVGDAMTINWAVTDAEGLDNNPISISYTINNSLWKDIITNADISNPSNISWMGSLTGSPTSGSGTITTFTAPSSAYFKLKIIVRDISNNTSIPIFSNLFNTSSWSVYAGSTDRGVGGGALAAAFYSSDIGNSVDIHPITGDIYALDSNYGLKRVDAQTGVVSIVIEHSTLNLPDSGVLPAQPQIAINSVSSIKFDPMGRLYLTSGSHANAKIYQIDFVNNWVRHYAGGGTNDDEGVSSTSLRATTSFGFDESNSMYLVTQCAPHTSPFNQGKRLLKIVQNPDGSPGAVTRIIGDCSFADPIYGSAAYSSPFGAITYAAMSSPVIWNNGDIIYFESYGSKRWKIINGIVYSVNFANNTCRSGGLTYNPSDGALYRTNSTCGIDKVIPSLLGNDGEINSTLFLGNSSSLGCTNDGILAVNACTLVDINIFTFGGLIYFSDGARSNAPSYYRIRYIAPDNSIRTIAGSKPFYGEGLDRSLIRGNFAGIYYKQVGEPNQVAFPAGLYFMDSKAAVFGYIDPSTYNTSVLWGNQARTEGGYSDGDTISKDLSLGTTYWGGSAMPITFDSNGLPWLRTDNQLTMVNASKQIVSKTTGGPKWETLADGSNPTNTNLFVNSHTNFTLKNQSIFMLGSAYEKLSSGFDPNVSIRILDFAGLITLKILGGNYNVSDSQNPSVDVGAGLVSAAPLYYNCHTDKCFTQYHAGSDRLYFSEKDKIRYITSPSNTATATLNTLMSSTGSISINNFIIRPDDTQIWYLSSTNKLYCYDISSGKSWCDNTTNHFSTIGAAGISFARGANQLTWKDNNSLLLSTYNGLILEFNLPTDP